MIAADEHRRVLQAGREAIFADYRGLRVAQVLRYCGMRERDEALADSRRVHDP